MSSASAPFPVGVIGAGAMGMGVVKSLRRAGFPTHVRDIRPEVHVQASALGAQCHPSAVALVAHCAPPATSGTLAHRTTAPSEKLAVPVGPVPATVAMKVTD